MLGIQKVPIVFSFSEMPIEYLDIPDEGESSEIFDSILDISVQRSESENEGDDIPSNTIPGFEFIGCLFVLAAFCILKNKK